MQTYLKLTELRLGLLINFNVQFLKAGVRRVVPRALYTGPRNGSDANNARGKF
jgi:hypothetical protein